MRVKFEELLGLGGVFFFVLLISGCSDGGSSSGSQETDPAAGDYGYLYAYNAYRLDGHTIRWAPGAVPVYGATGTGWEQAVRRWTMVRFEFVTTKPSSGIHILGYDDLGNICGLSSFSFNSAGKIHWCTVKINSFHDQMNCGRVVDTITHEIGHCIGLFKHTADGGIMDAKARNINEISSPVMSMFNLLYSIAPGTDINNQLAARQPSKIRVKGRYQSDGKKVYNGSLGVFSRSHIDAIAQF